MKFHHSWQPNIKGQWNQPTMTGDGFLKKNIKSHWKKASHHLSIGMVMTSGMVTHSVKTTLVHHITISLDGFFTCRLQSKATRLPQKPTAEATISAMVSVGYSSELNGINHPLVINTRIISNLLRSIGYNQFFICRMDCDGIIIIQI